VTQLAQHDADRHEHGVGEAAAQAIELEHFQVVLRAPGRARHRFAEAHVGQGFHAGVLRVDEAAIGGERRLDHGDHLAVDLHVPQILLLAVHGQRLLSHKAAGGLDIAHGEFVGHFRVVGVRVDADADVALHQRHLPHFAVDRDVVKRRRLFQVGHGDGQLLLGQQPRGIGEGVGRHLERREDHHQEREDHDQRHQRQQGVQGDVAQHLQPVATGFGSLQCCGAGLPVSLRFEHSWSILLCAYSS
jgi:hypothetical protein